ncbi:hypothetical protein ACFXOM_08940 [Streptomyces sp. NPDC059169]
MWSALARRSLSKPDKKAYYYNFAFAPLHLTVREPVRAAGAR